jgi:thiamine monophosphate synthase
VNARLNSLLKNRELFKVIAGIENFDANSVAQIAQATANSSAQAIDIACDASLIQMVKKNHPELLVFVSSTNPDALIAADKAGADVLELGNFDAMYNNGQEPTKADILAWSKAVLAASPKAPLCVTISGRLPLAEQLTLASELEILGVAILQTEGQVGPIISDQFAALSSAVNALGNTLKIRQVTTLPLLLAGGFTAESANFVLGSGANALGVGAAITKQGSVAEMVEAINEINSAFGAARTVAALV